jgi:hypothetical protein
MPVTETVHNKNACNEQWKQIIMHMDHLLLNRSCPLTMQKQQTALNKETFGISLLNKKQFTIYPTINYFYFDFKLATDQDKL